MNQERAESSCTLSEASARHHHEQPARRRLPGRHGNARTAIPATGFPGPRLGNLHDDERHLGLQDYDNNWKSTETLLRNLIDIASKGGNYLLNVGPTAEADSRSPASSGSPRLATG